MRTLLVKIWIALLLLAPIMACAAEENRVLRIGLPFEMPPFAFFDKNLNATRGFNVDLAVMLGKVLDAEVRLLGFQESEMVNALKRGKIDVIGSFLQKPEPDSGIHLIDTGIQVDKHLFTNKGCLTVTCIKDLPGHRIILPRNQPTENLNFPESSVEMIQSDSALDALKKLDLDEADVYVSNNSLTTLYQAQKLGLKNIKQVGMPYETVNLSLAVLENRPELLGDLSLGMGKILHSEHYESLKKKWFGQSYIISIWDQYIRYILIAVAGLALFLLVFASWSLLLKRQVKKITSNLVLSEQRYRELIESSPDLIHIISSDGQIQMDNKRARKLLKSNGANSDKMEFDDLFVQDQRQNMKKFVNELFKDGHGESEFTFLDGDGAQIPVEIVATTFCCPESGNLLASCFSRDVRLRKSLEEELIRSERLAIMGQMSAGIAHELNNPLGIISSYAQDIQAGDLDAETQKESLSTIVNNCERANHIINELLSFSRQSSPDRKPVDLMNILEASLLLVKSETKKRNIRVHKEYPTAPVVVSGDEHQLIQVFINLLTNAAQAVTEKGAITIRYDIPDQDQQQVVIDVEDNGSGIKGDSVKKLFDPFYTTKETGFGLGLFISNIIVRRHEGTILAEPGEEKGTIMRVTLPLSQDATVEIAEVSHA